jgi:hypothetical protein
LCVDRRNKGIGHKLKNYPSNLLDHDLGLPHEEPLRKGEGAAADLIGVAGADESTLTPGPLGELEHAQAFGARQAQPATVGAHLET